MPGTTGQEDGYVSVQGGSAISSPDPTMTFRGFVGFWAMLGSACLFVGNGPENGAFTCRSVDVTPRRVMAIELGATAMTRTAKAIMAAPASLRGPMRASSQHGWTERTLRASRPPVKRGGRLTLRS